MGSWLVPAGWQTKPRRRLAWNDAEAAKIESLWLLSDCWVVAADVMRQAAPAIGSRTRRKHILEAAELVRSMAHTALRVRKELKAARYGVKDGLVEWAMQTESVAMAVQDAAELSPRLAEFDAASVAQTGIHPDTVTDRSGQARLILERMKAAGRSRKLGPTALAYLEIGLGLKEPCRSKDEWDHRRQGWRQALRRAAVTSTGAVARRRGVPHVG